MYANIVIYYFQFVWLSSEIESDIFDHRVPKYLRNESDWRNKCIANMKGNDISSLLDIYYLEKYWSVSAQDGLMWDLMNYDKYYL